MPFLAYFAALIISAMAGAFGWHVLMAPSPEAKLNAQTVQQQLARKAAPNPARQIPLGQASATAEGKDDSALTPVYPANPSTTLANNAAPATPPETTGAAVAPQSEPAATAQQASTQPAVQTAPPQPAVQPAMQTTSTQNRCNVQACAGAYKSFRESDCTYQSFSGERRVCEMAPGQQERVASQPQEQPRSTLNARPSTRDADLRAVERRVRQLTDREMALGDEGRRGNGIAVIEMRDGVGYEAPEPYSRRWDTPRWR